MCKCMYEFEYTYVVDTQINSGGFKVLLLGEKPQPKKL